MQTTWILVLIVNLQGFGVGGTSVEFNSRSNCLTALQQIKQEFEQRYNVDTVAGVCVLKEG